RRGQGPCTGPSIRSVMTVSRLVRSRSCVMRPSPSIAAPLPDDVNVYLVLDDFGRQGRAWREVHADKIAVAVRDCDSSGCLTNVGAGTGLIMILPAPGEGGNTV